MMNHIILFGAGENAELAFYYFSKDSPYKVCAFVVDKEFHKTSSFCGLPVLTTESAIKEFPPQNFGAFIAVGYTRMNQLRKIRYQEFKTLGYTMVSYISSHCHCFTEKIGDNAFILEDNTIQPFVTIGSNVVLWSGNHIGHHSQIGSHCYITSHVVISGGVIVGDSCFFGVNATVRDHIEIAEGNMIGAGAIITKSTAPNQVYRAAKTSLLEASSDPNRKI